MPGKPWLCDGAWLLMAWSSFPWLLGFFFGGSPIDPPWDVEDGLLIGLLLDGELPALLDGSRPLPRPLYLAASVPT